MHLKSLTLRGFKSFASATTLEFEPGITCVVGPNGSGKSNVVDALAWVMGEQGAKTLRGGNMSDVIFAGTSGRPPLGRAEVALTIDNSDGALPIEYSEVTISRTLFRSGGSEYAINGASCRLLDIQDLLSDSGLGREMHVIVGQGQLDGVLRATPEERRHFIEEAAGILKHRRRKEKALRKLDSMQGNLTRVQDLTAEIRRQLGPLGKQAEVARQAQSIQSHVRDARSRLLADDISMLTTAIAKDQADESAIKERQAQVDAALAEAKARMAELERASAEATPALTKANDIYYRLTSQRERLRNLGTLAEERVRMLGSAVDSQPITDLVEMAEQLERAHTAREELDGEVREATTVLAAAETARAEAEQEADASERHLANLLRSVADRREGVARLAGDVAARRSSVEAMEAEIGRLREAHDAAERRARDATTEFQRLETTVMDVERGEEDLDAAHEAAVEALDEAKERLEQLKQGLARRRKGARHLGCQGGGAEPVARAQGRRGRVARVRGALCARHRRLAHHRSRRRGGRDRRRARSARGGTRGRLGRRRCRRDPVAARRGRGQGPLRGGGFDRVGDESSRAPAARRRMGLGPHRGLVGARVDREGLRLRGRRGRGPGGREGARRGTSRRGGGDPQGRPARLAQRIGRSGRRAKHHAPPGGVRRCLPQA